MIKMAIAVFVGSGLGGVCRWLLSDLTGRLVRGAFPAASMFPWGTLAVNILGCFIIGLVYGLADKGVAMDANTRLLLTTGFCGGLTTFSTFSHENYMLFQSHHLGLVLLYAALSLCIGLAAAYAGHALAR